MRKKIKKYKKEGEWYARITECFTQNVKRQIVALIDERSKEVSITKGDLLELKAIVKEIAKSQVELIQEQKQTN